MNRHVAIRREGKAALGTAVIVAALLGSTVSIPPPASATPLTLLAWTSDGVCGSAPSFAGGTGTAGDPYQVATGLQLQELADCAQANNATMATPDRYFVQTANIDLVGYGFAPISPSSYAGVSCGGPEDCTFRGSFDGNNFTISNLTVTAPSPLTIYSPAGVGLFGTIQGPAVVKNLNLVNPDVQDSTQDMVGSLVGRSNGGTIENVAAVNPTVLGGGAVGGLVGYADAGSMATSCVSSGTVTAVGGTGSPFGAGGFVGVSTIGPVSKSFTTATVNASNVNSGSFAGEIATSTVTDSYAIGGGSGFLTGGFAGRLRTTPVRAFVVSTLTSSFEGSGWAALEESSVVSSTSNFWDSDASGLTAETTSSSLATKGAATAQTTAWMQTASNWTSAGYSSSVWDLANGAYPSLKAFPSGCTFPKLTAPSFTADTPATTGTVGTAYSSYTFTASGSTPITFTKATGSLPPGLSLSSGGVLSGTPTTAGSYTFTVKAANGTSPDATTSSITIVISATPGPLAPTVTSVTPETGPLAGGTSVTIAGSNLTGASEVMFGEVAAVSFTVDSATQITAVTPAQAAGVVTVSVVTPGGVDSKTSAFTYVSVPGPALPSAPRGVTGETGALPGTVTATWRAPARDGGAEITDYEVSYRLVGDGAWRTFPHPPSTATTVVLSGLTAGAAYDVRVAAVNEVGRGPWAMAAEVDAGAAQLGLPGAPTLVSGVSGIGAGSISVSWRAPADTGGTDIVTYRVEYRLSPDGTWTVLSRPQSTATFAVIVGVEPGSGYDLRVAATTSVGRGAFGNGPATVTATAGEPSALDPVNPPTVPTGGSSLLVDGTPRPVTVDPNAPVDPEGLTFSGPGFDMSLFGRGDANDPLGITKKESLILQSTPDPVGGRVRNVRPVAVTAGEGFLANSRVQLFILPNRFLGTLSTDSAGRFAGKVPIPAGIKPGPYVLQANGFAPDGQVRSLSISIQIVAPGDTLKATAVTLFQPRSDVLTDRAKATLRALVRTTGQTAIRVSVAGYASDECLPPAARMQPRGDIRPLCHALALSRSRAEAVSGFLKRLGVTGRYLASGLGDVNVPGLGNDRRATILITYKR